jgi:subtilisin family serine protease
MKKWIKRVSLLTVGASLIASGTFTVQNAHAQSQNNDYTENYSSQITQRQIPQKQNPSQQSTLSSDTLVIKFTEPLTQTEHRLAGGTLIKQFSDLHYAVVKVKDKQNLDKIISNYHRFNKVVSVTPSTYYKPLALDDPKVTDQYQIDLLHLAKAQALAGKSKVIVAVIDQGIDSNHPDLKDRLLPSYNVVNPINPGAPDIHGTHVAGIIAADKGNGIGGYGVNPNAKILPIDVFDRQGDASDYAIAQGILYAINNGAKVINLSLGSSMPSPLIEEAIKKAIAKNVTVVAAAGNSGDETLSYPAAYEGVLSVGAIDKEKKLASYSSFGTSIDVVAPGDEIYSTIYEYEKKSSYRKLSGTSMASPMVAGAASLLLTKYPKLTPFQVEYILEHTAEDLGDKGFDIKYGNGLINPLAALQFDLKKLPSIINKPFSKKEQLEKAVPVTIKGKSTLRGGITTPFAEKWYKTEVKKGDNLQFILDGAAQFDYKLEINLYSSSQEKHLDVNKVREGKEEGKLFTAPFDGILTFAVKDVNGSYDDSGRGLSKYTLTVEKTAELPADESSLETPKQIDLPYKGGNESFTLTGAKGDDDYYRFSVKEQEAVKINLGPIPGVDTSISVYTADQLYPQTTEEKKAAGGDAPDVSQIDPAFYTNNGSYSEGETLTFMVDPEMQYVIKVSNKNDNNFGIYDYIMNQGLMETDQNPEPSLAPYKLEVDGKVLPPDEDMFPIGVDKSTAATDLGVAKTRAALTTADNGSDQNIEMIKEGSQPYKIGASASGYLQMLEDQDWFAVSPSETGIYQFALKQASGNIPLMEIYRIVEEKDASGMVTSYLDQIGTNSAYNSSIGQLTPSFYTGFKKGETYYIKMSTDSFSSNISFDPYQFSSKLMVKNPQDAYEDNDSLDKVKNNLPAKVIEGNFAMPNDVDTFYLEAKSSQIYGVTMDRKLIDENFRKKYPKELINPFFGMVTVVEDTNKNHKLDEKEYDKMQTIDHITDIGTTYGSFKAEKGKNYIVVISGSVDSSIPLTLWPYLLKISPVNLQDEDKASIVKHNIPSKPLALKAAGKNQLKATGYLNAGVPNGDEDWYALKVTKDVRGKIELAAGVEIDGTISLYKDGKLVTMADYYPEGDNEVLYFSLKKGNYFIKVRDINGNSTLNPYTLTVKYQ